MAIQINIRDVPERVRDELAARAALQGKSMQEFLRAELERLAARPSIDAWLQQEGYHIPAGAEPATNAAPGPAAPGRRPIRTYVGVSIVLNR